MCDVPININKVQKIKQNRNVLKLKKKSVVKSVIELFINRKVIKLSKLDSKFNVSQQIQ
jgi:hypothetical protein